MRPKRSQLFKAEAQTFHFHSLPTFRWVTILKLTELLSLNAYSIVSYDVAVIQLIMSCHDNRITTRLVPGRVAQSVGHLTRKSGVLGSIPCLATYFRFSFRFFKKGSCQLLAKVCALNTG